MERGVEPFADCDEACRGVHVGDDEVCACYLEVESLMETVVSSAGCVGESEVLEVSAREQT